METIDTKTLEPQPSLSAFAGEEPEVSPPPTSRRWILALIFLAVGIGATLFLVKTRPRLERKEAPVTTLLVRVLAAEPRALTLTVRSQGTVRPSTEASLVAEVPGRVVWVSPAFAAGGFFSAGQALVRLDPRDFELAVVRAQAEEKRSNVRLIQAKAEAELARQEWQELGDGREANPLTLREPQVAEAEAILLAAEAARQEAELNLERATLRAPYRGRVRSKQADVGQYLAPGQPIGVVYAVDFAEVRLPVPDDQLAFLRLPGEGRAEEVSQPFPAVVLSAEFAGATHRWQGEIVRTEGEIDPRSRMVHLVARVKDPYGGGEESGRPPMVVGLFVEAEIQGQERQDVVSLPRSALRGGEDRVLVLDTESRLRFRAVEVLRRAGDEVLISGGLEAGEQVCISPLEAPVDGMAVRTISPAAGEGAS